MVALDPADWDIPVLPDVTGAVNGIALLQGATIEQVRNLRERPPSTEQLAVVAIGNEEDFAGTRPTGIQLPLVYTPHGGGEARKVWQQAVIWQLHGGAAVSPQEKAEGG